MNRQIEIIFSHSPSVIFDQIPATAREASPLTWFAVAGAYHLSLGGRERLVIRETLLGGWQVTRLARGGAAESLGALRRFEKALRGADAWVHMARPDQMRLLRADGRWREEEATGKQRALLGRLGVPIRPGLTKGDAALLISAAFARRGWRDATRGVRGRLRGDEASREMRVPG